MPGTPLTEEQKFCLQGCRSYEQYAKMRQDFEAGKCAFCELDPELNKILFEDEHAKAWHVHPSFLRQELRYHGIVVPVRHIRFVSNLTDAEVLSVHHLMQQMNMHFDYQGGLWHAREGDMRLNAGTVPHLHFNIFEPNPDMVAETNKDVRVPVYKLPDDRGADQVRAAEFARSYEAGEVPTD